MKSPTTYHSPLRAAQAAATTQRILEAVGAVLERGDEPTFAHVADAAGCQERTVYRHFPTKEDLAAAFWDWQYSLIGPATGRSAPRHSCLPSSTARFAASTNTPS